MNCQSEFKEICCVEEKYEDIEGQFLCGLLELGHGIPDMEKLKKDAEKVKWAKGWPEDKEAFWNAEAFMWNYKIKREKRLLISNELKFLSRGRNLDLGCGAYSYLPSVGFDMSKKMLQFNDACHEKVVGDLEKVLPFADSSFDSATAMFLLNYVANYKQLLQEIQRILKHNGTFVMVLSAEKVNEWQRQKEVSVLSRMMWCEVLAKFFVVNFYEKEGLWFFKCGGK